MIKNKERFLSNIIGKEVIYFGKWRLTEYSVGTVRGFVDNNIIVTFGIEYKAFQGDSNLSETTENINRYSSPIIGQFSMLELDDYKINWCLKNSKMAKHIEERTKGYLRSKKYLFDYNPYRQVDLMTEYNQKLYKEVKKHKDDGLPIYCYYHDKTNHIKAFAVQPEDYKLEVLHKKFLVRVDIGPRWYRGSNLNKKYFFNVGEMIDYLNGLGEKWKMVKWY